jgi:cytochrome c oxidase subunit 1
MIAWGAWLLAAFQLPFIFNFFWSAWKGERVGKNPWHSTTLEWQAPSPPPHGNFLEEPRVHRGPYEYSVPGASEDYTPQWLAEPSEPPEGPQRQRVPAE